MQDAWIYGRPSKLTEDSARVLAELGYSPRVVSPGQGVRPSGEDGAPLRHPEFVLIAGGEPTAAGFCARLREEDDLREVPILATVAPDELESTIGMLDAAELIVHPFTPREMRARIARARRGTGGVGADEVIRVEDLELNLSTHRLTIGAMPVALTPVEYQLLKFLLGHPRRVFSREALLRCVWSYQYYGGTRTVDVHIRRLRAKVGPKHARAMITVRGSGYLYDPQRVAGPGDGTPTRLGGSLRARDAALSEREAAA
jgi:DNA-binding response OmpR family regulator